MGQLLYFYFIEAHSDHAVAAEFCKKLYASWVDRNYEGWVIDLINAISRTFVERTHVNFCLTFVIFRLISFYLLSMYSFLHIHKTLLFLDLTAFCTVNDSSHDTNFAVTFLH